MLYPYKESVGCLSTAASATRVALIILDKMQNETGQMPANGVDFRAALTEMENELINFKPEGVISFLSRNTSLDNAVSRGWVEINEEKLPQDKEGMLQARSALKLLVKKPLRLLLADGTSSFISMVGASEWLNKDNNQLPEKCHYAITFAKSADMASRKYFLDESSGLKPLGK